MSIIEFAKELLNENIAAIPVRSNKAPNLPKDSQYFKKHIPESKVGEFFDKSTTWGVGVKCGMISGGIECIDFDDKTKEKGIKQIFNSFLRHEFITHLWQSNKAFIQQTPSGGFHYIYKYDIANESGKYGGSKRLACWQDETVMIETRGEGGWFVCNPSPGYKKLQNDLTEIESIEQWERDLVIEIAKDFDQTKKKTEGQEDVGLKVEKTDPVSFFNAEKIAFAKKLLEDHGWQKLSESEGIEYWRRPGKDEGVSATWGHRSAMLYVFSSNVQKFEPEMYYSPFQILVKLRFKGIYKDALEWVENKYEFKKPEDVPYVRVGTSYFKIIKKKDRYNIMRTELKVWTKDEIKDDHGKPFLKEIPKYDDFVIEPDNFNYKPTINNCYNLYSEFPFKPEKGSWYWTKIMLEHVFGEQLEAGLKYLQALYLHPRRILPILALISKTRGTGKTTFLNWINMMFGGNATIISPEDLKSQFNASYATKNVVCIEETTIEKEAATEKLKAISTSKYISYNQKYVNPTKLPLYCKIIIASNNEDRFVKIDDQEIRFFVRKLGMPKNDNANIEDNLIKEIPAFLHYLTKRPALDLSKSRMILTPDEIDNRWLRNVKDHSKNVLCKDLTEYLVELFQNSEKKIIYASPSDIKEHWFKGNHRIDLNYIKNTLRNDFEKTPVEKTMRYVPLDGDEMAGTKKAGRPFQFERGEFLMDEDLEDDVPF